MVAGEASGDLHAAGVAAALKRIRPELGLAAVGGRRLAEQGVELIEESEAEDRESETARGETLEEIDRGDTDKARQLLHDVLEADKNNQDAREILSALSWSPSDPSAFR